MSSSASPQLPNMERWAGKVAVVSGASAGIGAAICLDLVRSGLTVIGLARRVELVEALNAQLVGASGRLVAKRCDVTRNEDVNAVFDDIEAKFGYVSILVNNAGVAKDTMILNDDNDDDLLQIIATNFCGLINCTKATYRQLKSADAYGHIININSIFGHKVVMLGETQNTNVYPGSKHAVTATTEVIRQELNSLQNRKVRVTSISPGLVETEIFARGGYANTELMFQALPSLRPADVSQTVLFALAVPEHVLVTELTVKPVGEVW